MKKDYENEFPVILLVMEFEGFTTKEEVDARIDFLEANKWLAQIAALKYIGVNPGSEEALEKGIDNNEVYQAIIARI